jgi:hypothetical protein
METKENSKKDNRIKLLNHFWYLNGSDYQEQISFIWRNNEIRIDIRVFCYPPGKNKQLDFNFFINGEHTLSRFFYNCYGGGRQGKTPEMISENYKLTFITGPYSIEVFQEKTEEERVIDPREKVPEEKMKNTWFGIDNKHRLISICETPFKDPEISLWIKKSFNYKYKPDILLFRYEIYTSNLFHITPWVGNFKCNKIYDHYQDARRGIPSYMVCEISDGKGEYRVLYFKRRGLEDLTIADIIQYIHSLCNYIDWKDFDQYQNLCRSAGLTDIEIGNLFNNEISELGINTES